MVRIARGSNMLRGSLRHALVAGVVLTKRLASFRPILVGAAAATVQPCITCSTEVTIDALVGAPNRSEVAFALC